jgi:adenylosuccinate synthase
MALVLVVSGPICAGKTTLSCLLHSRAGFKIVSARQVLSVLSREVADRRELQLFGRRLESETRGGWLARSIAEMSRGDAETPIVVDSARTKAQLDAIRRDLDGPVTHIHLTARESTRNSRFEDRGDQEGFEAGRSFNEYAADPIEVVVSQLEGMADATIDSTHMTPRQVLASVSDFIDPQLQD